MISKPDRLAMNAIGAAVALGLVLILGFTTWALIFREIPKSNESAFLILIGILSTNITSIISFFYGRTVDDRKNQETISELVKKQTDTSATSAAITAQNTGDIARNTEEIAQASRQD